MICSIHQEYGEKKIFNRKLPCRVEVVKMIEDKIVEIIDPYIEDTDIVLAGFAEIVCNAIEHGNQLDPEKSVYIKISLEDDHIKFVIKDEGEGFDWRSKMSKTLDIDNFEERGRGIIITKGCFDSFSYNEKGNEVTLIKKINKNLH